MDDPAQNPPTVPSGSSALPSSTPLAPAEDLAQLTRDPVPSFAEEIKQFDANHPQASPKDDPDFQIMYNHGGHFKEQLEAMATSWVHKEQSSVSEKPVQQMEEIHSSPEIEPTEEIAGYMEKVEKAAELGQPVVDDYTNKVLLASSANQNPTIVLPLTADQVEQGLHHKVWEAVTWLAFWCARQIKLLPGRVKYKS